MRTLLASVLATAVVVTLFGSVLFSFEGDDELAFELEDVTRITRRLGGSGAYYGSGTGSGSGSGTYSYGYNTPCTADTTDLSGGTVVSVHDSFECGSKTLNTAAGASNGWTQAQGDGSAESSSKPFLRQSGQTLSYGTGPKEASDGNYYVRTFGTRLWHHPRIH